VVRFRNNEPATATITHVAAAPFAQES